MRSILIAFVTIMMTSIAFADISTTGTKIDIPSDPGTPDARDGGETVGDAFVIPSLPFTDTGNTSDNLNDYDEACPYTGSLSPDVVYAWVPGVDGVIDIEMCESGYDTKLYIYENAVTPGAPYACNDDHNECALMYRSMLHGIQVLAGNTYYLVIDGYGGEMGEYLLSVIEGAPPYPPCELECPAGGVAEGEPPLVDGYWDSYNGGCQSTPYVFQVIDCPTLCAKSGWYTNSGGNRRDDDWFTMIADDGGYVTASAFAEETLSLFLTLPADCETTYPVLTTDCYCYESGTIEFEHPAGTELWIWCGPAEFSGPTSEFDYILTISGIEYSPPTSIDECSWGNIKKEFMH